jgi:hypothetical protein
MHLYAFVITGMGVLLKRGLRSLSHGPGPLLLFLHGERC